MGPWWTFWIPTIISMVALLVAGFAAGASWRSLKWERLSAESVARQADAAERALNTPPPVAQEPGADIEWRLERPEKYRFVLRNVGRVQASGVTVEVGETISRHLPAGVSVQPGGSVEFQVFGSWTHPTPNEMRVTRDGDERGVLVPVPAAP